MSYYLTDEIVKSLTEYAAKVEQAYEIISKYDKEPLGYCSIFLTTKPMEGSLVVVFNTYKVNTNDVVYPSITLPPSRCECDNDILGHYFYLLVDQLYHMTAF